jgi:hypothetical protein
LLSGCRDPYSAAGGILLLPVFALGGAIYGAITDQASEDVATAEATLKTTFAGVKVQDVIRDHIVATARDRTRHALVLLHHTDRPGPGEASRYAALAERGVTTVLEVRVPQVALVAQRMHHDPPMSMVMRADVELIRVNDGAAIYRLSLERTRGNREFLAWGANSAEAFRDEVTAMSVTLANDIVDKVFAADLLPPPEPLPPAPTGAHDAVQTQDRGPDQSARQE